MSEFQKVGYSRASQRTAGAVINNNFGMAAGLAARGVSEDASVVIPAERIIERVIIINNTANVVTGGITLTLGGQNLLASANQAVGANSKVIIELAGLTTTAANRYTIGGAKDLEIKAVTSWNGALIDVILVASDINFAQNLDLIVDSDEE